MIVACPAEADDGPSGVGSHEIWVGGDAGTDNWLVYGGSTYAPWGDIHQDGFRVRSTAGYGEFSYHWDKTTLVQATKNYADLLVGYQKRLGELTAKGFIGLAMLNDLDVPSATVRRNRQHLGIKGALELWLNLGENAWTSFDASYADTRQTVSVRSRLGYRLFPTISTGVEAVFNHSDLKGQVQIDPALRRVVGNARAGAFVRYEWFGGEVSGSAGVAGDVDESLGATDLLRTPSVYGTVNLILQF